MRFEALPLKGAYRIEPEKREDERGFFARLFCRQEFENLGLDAGVVQINNSLNHSKGTLRGIHYQMAPWQETKIVRCIQGRLWDVMLDLRPESETFGQWYGAELSARNRSMLYIPKGFGHGFLTLEEETEILYLTTQYYTPSHERTVRWDDPRFAIGWPAVPAVVSEKDRQAPDFSPVHHLDLEKTGKEI
jgi:dTDP-4-dehydrorhamnose 3,5-epimerase